MVIGKTNFLFYLNLFFCRAQAYYQTGCGFFQLKIGLIVSHAYVINFQFSFYTKNLLFLLPD